MKFPRLLYEAAWLTNNPTVKRYYSDADDLEKVREILFFGLYPQQIHWNWEEKSLYVKYSEDDPFDD